MPAPCKGELLAAYNYPTSNIIPRRYDAAHVINTPRVAEKEIYLIIIVICY